MVKSIHTKEYAYFAERLRKARLEAGLTQVQVAKKLGRPQSLLVSSGVLLLVYCGDWSKPDFNNEVKNYGQK